MPSKNKSSFMYYPELTSPSFNEEIYIKNEFRTNEIKNDIDLNQKIIKNENKIQEFELEPHQNFLKNYISPDTPYNGILIFHGTGVGKTCSAISIAEGFKKTLKNINKKVLIICNPGIDKNFKKEIYDFSKEKTSKEYQNINLQCTGRDYDLGIESMYLTKNQRIKEVKKMISSYYEFIGYIKFANIIKKKTNNWEGDEESINDKIKQYISKEFDDRVIIIDEIQNIKTAKTDKLEKTVQNMLMSIIKYGKNIKLVLMSATPMFDRADEIIFYLNLLLENDKRKNINKNEIFDGEGNLKQDAERFLKKILTGYVSYVRAEKPYIFPFKIYPKKAIIPQIKYDIHGNELKPDNKIKFTKLINLNMNSVQNETYMYYYNKKTKSNFEERLNENNNFIENDNKNTKKNIFYDLIEISNIVYPKKDKGKKGLSPYGSFGKESMDSSRDNGKSGFIKKIEYRNKKKIVSYKYQKHALFNEGKENEVPFMDEKHINNYSTKFDSVLKSIKHSKGLIFIYSFFIDQGVIPLALMLEQNGISRKCSNGENQLLDYSPNKKKGGGKSKPICYLCGKTIEKEVHQNKSVSDYHVFRKAQYILFLGEPRDIIKIRKEDAVSTFSNKNNMYGEEVKIFIGTTSVSEGLDFKNIRQVHIIEPWYNLSRHSQIMGRAIRKNSHINLPAEEQNVEVFEYCTHMNSKTKLQETETVDLRIYRNAELKNIIIKKINRILKESSVDCVLFKKANIILSKKKIKQINSNGETVEVNLGDCPYSSICDYYQNCDYQCNWTPNKKITYPINNDTFNISSGKNEIQKCRNIILSMFKENYAYYEDNIKDEVKKKYPDMNNLFIYSALEQLTNNKNEIIVDKFNIKGYIIYVGDYYVFQPIDVVNTKIPIEYRMNPLSNKKKSVPLQDHDFEYVKNKQSNINENKYIDKFNNKLKLIDYYLKNSHIIFNNIDKDNKYFQLSIVGTLVDTLNEKNEHNFIELVLLKYYINDLNQSEKDILHLIINYYKQRNMILNYYQDCSYNKNKIKNNIYVGFISYGVIYVLKQINQNESIKNINFGKVSFEKATIIKKDSIKDLRRIYLKNDKIDIKNSNDIYGLLEFMKNEKKFKIVNTKKQIGKTTQEGIESKRGLYTGRVCGTIKKPELKDICNNFKINIKLIKKVEQICYYIEIYLRYHQYLKTNLKTWFIYDKVKIN